MIKLVQLADALRIKDCDIPFSDDESQSVSLMSSYVHKIDHGVRQFVAVTSASHFMRNLKDGVSNTILTKLAHGKTDANPVTKIEGLEVVDDEES